MTYQFSHDQLEFMRRTQEGHMLDACYLQDVSEAKDSFGQVVPSFPADGDPIPCGLDMRPGSERHTADKTVLIYDATLRLPLTTDPHKGDRIKIVKRFGEDLDTPLIWEIVSPPQRGPSGLRLLLKKVEPSS